jgi:hypothetical protein
LSTDLFKIQEVQELSLTITNVSASTKRCSVSDQGQEMSLAFAVLKETFLQSGKMLIDIGGKSYEAFRKGTDAALLESLFMRKAAHSPDTALKI